MKKAGLGPDGNPFHDSFREIFCQWAACMPTDHPSPRCIQAQTSLVDKPQRPGQTYALAAEGAGRYLCVMMNTQNTTHTKVPALLGTPTPPMSCC